MFIPEIYKKNDYKYNHIHPHSYSPCTISHDKNRSQRLNNWILKETDAL